MRSPGRRCARWTCTLLGVVSRWSQRAADTAEHREDLGRQLGHHKRSSRCVWIACILTFLLRRACLSFLASVRVLAWTATVKALFTAETMQHSTMSIQASSVPLHRLLGAHLPGRVACILHAGWLMADCILTSTANTIPGALGAQKSAAVSQRSVGKLGEESSARRALLSVRPTSQRPPSSSQVPRSPPSDQWGCLRSGPAKPQRTSFAQRRAPLLLVLCLLHHRLHQPLPQRMARSPTQHA